VSQQQKAEIAVELKLIAKPGENQEHSTTEVKSTPDQNKLQCLHWHQARTDRVYRYKEQFRKVVDWIDEDYNIKFLPSELPVQVKFFEYKVRIKSIGNSSGKIDLFQILLRCLKILQNTSIVHRYTFANGVATTRRLPGRRIPEGP
jgi:hypothetical protein